LPTSLKAGLNRIYLLHILPEETPKLSIVDVDQTSNLCTSPTRTPTLQQPSHLFLMSHPQPPQRQPTHGETERYIRTIHNVALGALVACPIIALLPPRKLDFFTFGLAGTTAYSANYLIRERTGQSIWQHLGGSRAQGAVSTPMAEVSSTEQANLSRELQYAKEEMQRLHIESKAAAEHSPASQSAREAWKAQREKEIQDDLDVGKGLGEMITDQIWEVWNWRKRRDDEDDG